MGRGRAAAAGAVELLAALALLALLALPRPAAAQPAPLEGLDDYVIAAMEAWNVPGLALAVIADGEVVHARGYGVRDVRTGAPVDENTLFAVGSTSKAFTSAALGLLVDEGRLSWDDRVIDHIPWFAMYDAYATRELTVRDLLTHRSGLARGDAVWSRWPHDRHEIIRRIRFLEPTRSFRGAWQYQNLMFLTAGEVVRVASGQTWDDFVDDRIFTPLGMDRSVTSVTELDRLDNVATPHVAIDKAATPVAHKNIDNVGPAGSIYSSVAQMARWVGLHLAGGVHAGERLFSDSVMAEMHRPQMLIQADAPENSLHPRDAPMNFNAYGLAWWVLDYRGRKVVDHGGGIDGMRAHVAFMPEEGIGMVALSNARPNNLIVALMYRVFDHFLGAGGGDKADVAGAGGTVAMQWLIGAPSCLRNTANPPRRRPPRAAAVKPTGPPARHPRGRWPNMPAATAPSTTGRSTSPTTMPRSASALAARPRAAWSTGTTTCSARCRTTRPTARCSSRSPWGRTGWWACSKWRGWGRLGGFSVDGNPNVTSGLAVQNLPAEGHWSAAIRMLALFCMTAAGTASAQEDVQPPPGPTRDALTGLATHIAESMPDWDIPGLAVAVVHEGEVVFARGFGVKEVGRDDPVDARTLFQVGSVSKSFAAAAIGALVDEGLAGWDDQIIQHLPWFRVKDPWITREITLRDLLSHQSGMPGAAYPVLAVVDARETAEGLRLLDNQAPLRQGYRYSNQAYGVAGLVVEAAAGMSWGAWVRERLLGPLEMRDSRTSPYDVWDSVHVAPTFLGSAPAGIPGIDDAPGRNVAMPHGMDRRGDRRVLSWQSYDNMQAAGSVVSNVVDMANWVRMQLDHGRFDGVAVLDSATVSEMHAPQVRTPSTFVFADPGTGGYGLGWGRASFLGHTYISHGGGIFGFPAYVGMLPEANAGSSCWPTAACGRRTTPTRRSRPGSSGDCWGSGDGTGTVRSWPAPKRSTPRWTRRWRPGKQVASLGRGLHSLWPTTRDVTRTNSAPLRRMSSMATTACGCTSERRARSRATWSTGTTTCFSSTTTVAMARRTGVRS